MKPNDLLLRIEFEDGEGVTWLNAGVVKGALTVEVGTDEAPRFIAEPFFRKVVDGPAAAADEIIHQIGDEQVVWLEFGENRDVQPLLDALGHHGGDAARMIGALAAKQSLARPPVAKAA